MANQNAPTGQPGGSIPLPRSKRGMKGFWSEVGRELKKVSWPTKQETTRLTGVVLAVCIGAVVLLYLLSTVFHEVLNILSRGF
jgi:preprotein translocase subunit SecE